MDGATQDTLLHIRRALLQQGYAAATWADLAANAGITEADLRSSFPTKEQMACEAIRLSGTPQVLAANPAESWRDHYGQTVRLIADLLIEDRQCDTGSLFKIAVASLEQIGAQALGADRSATLAREVICVICGGATWAYLYQDRAPLDRMIASLCAELPTEELEEDAIKVLKRYGIPANGASRSQQKMAAEIADLDDDNFSLRAALVGQAEAASCFL